MTGARRIPLEDFFRKPERDMVRLSPDGRYLSWLAPWKRRMNLFVRDLESGEERRVTGTTERDLAGYLWADDRRLVYVQDTGGDENWRLHAVGRDGSDARELTPFAGVKCQLVDELEGEEREILFSMNRRDPQVFDVYRLDVYSGEMRCVATNPGSVRQWVTDWEGRLRAAKTSDGVRTGILFRETEQSEWRAVADCDFRDEISPICFTFDNRALYVTSNLGRDRSAIFEFDPATGGTGRLVFEHPDVDVSRLLRSRHRRRITGVRYETDRPLVEYFDEQSRRLQELVDRKLPGRANLFVSHARDESRFVVLSYSDRVPASFWLLDAARGELTHLFDGAPWLNADELAEQRPIRFRSRDGLEIRGYLTRPPGAAAGRSPMVVYPHGGPWHRDSWGFDPTIQFLANRGFAVLQVNFRGSTGFGKRFWQASFGQWGLAMQDDVTDGVRWAIEERFADPARIAIYGASYGGYAALSGLTRTPELYACGISYVGVSNLFTWLAAFPPYWKPYLAMVHEMVGHPERDRERLRETSPLFAADRIRAPLLVLQGANDPRVKKEESDQIVAALERRGVPVEYVVKENEGHGFRNEENQLEAYRRIEAFLARHLPPGPG